MIPSWINFTSKTCWLGIAMIAAGLYMATGIDIPGIDETALIKAFFPEEPAALIKAGFAMLFMRHAVAKMAT